MKKKKYDGSEMALRAITLLAAGGGVSIVLFSTPDLRTASQSPKLWELIRTEQKIDTWTRKHKIDFKDIVG